MPNIKTSLKDIRDGAKNTITDRKVSPKLANGLIQMCSIVWTTFKTKFLIIYFWILKRLKTILPLP